jgi:hypothetical protein
MKRPELLILALAFFAMAAKVYCAWTTIGTADVPFFAQYGRVVALRGVPAIYREEKIYNHPPLLTAYIGFVSEWSGNARQPKGTGIIVARLIRLPGVLADFVLVLVLLWVRRKTGQPPWWLLALFAVSPVSFMITGYHGNFDPFIALGLTLTAAACLANRPHLCGLLLGLTAQVKVIPLLVAPIFFFYWLHRRRALPFAATAVTTTLLGWIVPLIAIPITFLTHVLGQNSIWGWWGFTFLLRLTGAPTLQSASPPYNVSQTAVILLLKVIVIGAVLALAWRRRHLPANEVFKTLALAFLVFLVFAPGFGVQYLLWLPPFLLFLSPRWFVAVMIASTIGLFVFYDTISGGQLPWDKGFLIQPHIATWGPWLLVPWSVLAACLVCQCLPRHRMEKAALPAEV